MHALKIDQSFVRDIGIDSDDSALITANIAMATSLRVRLIAEVETPEQENFLQSSGCPAAQGFRFAVRLALPSFSLFAGCFRGAPFLLSLHIDQSQYFEPYSNVVKQRWMTIG